MCLVLYLGTNRQRQLIAWDESSPCFHVKDDDDDAKQAAIHLHKQLTYYVGSDNGCGCGFRQEYDHMIDDADELASKTDNQQRLHDYAANCLDEEETIELYSCWSGDEALSIEHDRTIRLNDLLDDSFWFAERQRTVVCRNATPSPAVE